MLEPTPATAARTSAARVPNVSASRLTFWIFDDTSVAAWISLTCRSMSSVDRPVWLARF
jgi:hypothetical protein